MMNPCIAIKAAMLSALMILMFAGALAADEADTPQLAVEQAAPTIPPSEPMQKFRGVFFNPSVSTNPDRPWLVYYQENQEEIRALLQDLSSTAGVNLIDMFVVIAYSLKTPSQAPQEGQPFSEWGNAIYYDNICAFVDDCYDAGIAVELDLACNMWIPYSVDPERQIANSKHWPMPDETPWNESATWYSESIKYIEGHAKHPENIAMWSMMGHYELGTAEPCLWGVDDNPALLVSIEKFVKEVWPVFRAAGKRPKAAPYAFPIFSNSSYWMAKSPDERLSGFIHLKKWILDDLALPPDYWPISTYPFCDPAPDGTCYIQRIVDILGKENAPRILSTDFKAIGIDFSDTIISDGGRSSAEMLEWNLQQCEKYGFAGWWVWCYQDGPNSKTGLRDANGVWKPDLLAIIKKQAPAK